MYDWQITACAKDFKITNDFNNGIIPLLSKIIVFIKAKSVEEAVHKIQEWYTLDDIFIYEVKKVE